jgi:photosystem II stability/assembly factor-like uncharacterized protein
MRNHFYKFLISIPILIIIISSFLIRNSEAQWVQMSNGMGSDQWIHALASIGTNIFAGTDSNGVYLSTNNGESWSEINSGLTNKCVYTFAVSGNNIFSGTADGVFLSTNNGGNWTAVNNGLTCNEVWTLTASGTNLFAGTYPDGVFLSTNNGRNWISVNNGLTNKRVSTFIVSGSNIFSGTDNGVFLSTNNGRDWTEACSNLKQKGLQTKCVNSLASIGTNLFAGTGTSMGGGVFLSTNNGDSWAEVDDGLGSPKYIIIYTLAVHETNIFAGTKGGIFLSTDNGRNWLNKDQGFVPVSNTFSLLIANGYIFAGTYDNSVWCRKLNEILEN